MILFKEMKDKKMRLPQELFAEALWIESVLLQDGILQLLNLKVNENTIQKEKWRKIYGL